MDGFCFVILDSYFEQNAGIYDMPFYFFDSLNDEVNPAARFMADPV